VFGTALTQPGTYPSATTMSAVSPVVDLQGGRIWRNPAARSRCRISGEE